MSEPDLKAASMGSTAEDAVSPYMQENFRPVHEEVTAFDLAVTGQIPEELEGRYLRNGPNPIGAVDMAHHHWFMGDGMVHGVRLRGGRAEWYRNRWVRGADVRKALGEPDIAGPLRSGDFAANTNVIGFAGTTLALIEAGPLPVELDYELTSLRRHDFGGTLPGAFGPHPKLDPKTGDLHVLCYDWRSWRDHVQYVVVSPQGRVKKTANIPLPGMVMLHDTGLTDRYVIILDLPVLMDMNMARQGYELPFQWNDGYNARVGLMPRDGDGSQVHWFEVTPCYVYHIVNAYDTADGGVVIDVIHYDRVAQKDVRGPLGDSMPTIDRWTIDPTQSRVQERRLDDRHQDFPRVHPGRISQAYRYAYTTLLNAGVGFAGLAKHDLVRDQVQTHDFGRGRTASEPAIVPKKQAADPEASWVLSYIYDAATDRSDLIILDGEDFDGAPVATIHLPQRVPYGFHGEWIAD